MATYKKRSRKNISKSNSNANLSSTKQVFETLDESASKTEIFVNKYQKYLSGAVLVLVLIFVLYFFDIAFWLVIFYSLISFF